MTSTSPWDGLTKLLVGPIAFLAMRRRRSGEHGEPLNLHSAPDGDRDHRSGEEAIPNR
jgi:hypothetical protein